MYKVQSIHDYSEGLHSRIQSTLFPTEYDMDVHVPSLYITSLGSISLIREKSHFPSLDLSFSPEYFPNALIRIIINSIQSKATNTEEQAIGSFSRRNLERLSTWDEW